MASRCLEMKLVLCLCPVFRECLLGSSVILLYSATSSATGQAEFLLIKVPSYSFALYLSYGIVGSNSLFLSKFSVAGDPCFLRVSSTV